MNMTLLRTEKRSDGIFSILKDEAGREVAFTLEHAYPNSDGNWFAKIPTGTFNCIRGTHQLHNGIPFETFEVIGVPGHLGLLFHCGNFDADSEGCILLGDADFTEADGTKILSGSRDAFKRFMSIEFGANQFTLTVV